MAACFLNSLLQTSPSCDGTAGVIDMPSRRNRIDVHVGSRIRLRRIQLSIERNRLATSLGVSAKTMQQFESGAARVAAGPLYSLSQLLEVVPSYFFADLPATNAAFERESAATTA